MRIGRRVIGACAALAGGVALVSMLTVACTAGSSLGGVLDLDGRTADPLAGEKSATVLIFARADCPISNRYAPVLGRLHERFAPRGVAFFLVFPDPDATPAAIERHLEEYAIPFPALRDAHHALVDATGASVTPEAAVFDQRGSLVYRGRIDDRWVSFGRQRPQPTRHDVAEALDALAAGEVVELRTTPAVGCFISDLPRAEDGQGR